MKTRAAVAYEANKPLEIEEVELVDAAQCTCERLKRIQAVHRIR